MISVHQISNPCTISNTPYIQMYRWVCSIIQNMYLTWISKSFCEWKNYKVSFQIPSWLFPFFFFLNKHLEFNSSILPSFGSRRHSTRVLKPCSQHRGTLCQSSAGICNTPTNIVLLCSAPSLTASLIQSHQPSVPVKQIELIQKRGLFACMALTSTQFHSAALLAAWYKWPLRSINADSKERFNCIQENMPIETLTIQVIFILCSSVLLNQPIFVLDSVFLIGLWFRHNARSSFISGNGKGLRRRSNGWRSWRRCAGENSGEFQQIFVLQYFSMPGIALNTQWYHHKGSCKTLPFLSVEQNVNSQVWALWF